jgi:uncharacterized protein YkwD
MRNCRAAVAISVLVLLGWPESGGATGCPVPPGTPGVEAAEQEFARATECILQEERAARGLAQLRRAHRLDVAAESHGRDMVSRRFFAHVSPAGSRLIDRVRASRYLRGWPGYELGEILAWGTGSLSSPPSIVGAWLDSPGHRRIVVSPGYRDVGVAAVAGVPLASDVAGGTYAVVFGRRHRP